MSASAPDFTSAMVWTSKFDVSLKFHKTNWGSYVHVYMCTPAASMLMGRWSFLSKIPAKMVSAWNIKVSFHIQASNLFHRDARQHQAVSSTAGQPLSSDYLLKMLLPSHQHAQRWYRMQRLLKDVEGAFKLTVLGFVLTPEAASYKILYTEASRGVLRAPWTSTSRTTFGVHLQQQRCTMSTSYSTCCMHQCKMCSGCARANKV